MEGKGVSQDSQAMKDLANEISNDANDFLARKNEIFDEMRTKLGAEETNTTIWWGPQAALFLENFEKKEQVFDNAYKNIVSMANNLEAQANAWERFENNG